MTAWAGIEHLLFAAARGQGLTSRPPCNFIDIVWNVGAAAGEPGEGTQTEKLQMRGNESAESISRLTNLGRELEAQGKTVDAERAYRDAVTIMAEPMNDLAWIYLTSGRTKDALALAVLATELRSDEPRFEDTLAKAKDAAK